MNFQRLLQIKGANLWLLASAVGANLIYAVTYLFVGYLGMVESQGISPMMQMLLVLGAFLGPFLIGLLIALWAGDGRGATYGLYGSLGGMIPVALVTVPGGVLGVLLVMLLLLGGLNGGLIAEYLRHRGDKRLGNEIKRE
jgi:hypothetical protein